MIGKCYRAFIFLLPPPSWLRSGLPTLALMLSVRPWALGLEGAKFIYIELCLFPLTCLGANEGLMQGPCLLFYFIYFLPNLELGAEKQQKHFG